MLDVKGEKMLDNANMRAVDSSNLKAIGYDPNTRELFVQMARNDSVYKYADVSLNLFERFSNAESKGRFFVQEIKDRFQTTKLD